MKTLLETLGTEAAYRFLAFALPQFEQRSAELLGSLRTGDFKTAAECAHKLKGTVHLYASPELQEILCNIIDNRFTKSNEDDFLDNLEKEISATKNKIQLFMANS